MLCLLGLIGKFGKDVLDHVEREFKQEREVVIRDLSYGSVTDTRKSLKSAPPTNARV